MTDSLRPYPEYKDSGVDWLKNVPTHWRLEPLFGEYEEKQVKNTGLVEKTVLSLSYGRIVIKPEEKLHGLVPASFETYQIVDPGDIIIRPTDLQNDLTSLRIGFSGHRGIITSAYMCLRTWNDLSPEYGYQVLNVFDLTKAIYAYGSGLRQNLSFDDLKRVRIPVPPPDEQAAIVTFLDTAEKRIRRYIRAKQWLIKLLNEQKQAIIQQAVTRGLDPDAPMKDSGIQGVGLIPNHWETFAMKFAFEAMDYGISDASTDDGAIRVLTMGNIKDGEIAVPKSGGVDVVDEYLLLKANDLLFNRTNSAELVGKVGIYRGHESPVTFASYLVRLRCNRRSVPEYMNYLLNSIPVVNIARSLAIPSLHQSNLNPTRYGRITLCFPPYEEQLQITDYLKQHLEPIESTIMTAEETIASVREYRTRLIADVVTGKVDVRGLAFEMPEVFDEYALLDVDDLLEEDDVLEDVVETD